MDTRVDLSRARELKDRLGGSMTQEIDLFSRISVEGIIPELVKYSKYGKREISNRKRKSFKGKIPKDYFGYNINFYSIFKVDVMETAFWKFLEIEKNTEPMEFLRELKKFTDKEMTKSDRKKLFNQIIETFIIKDSPKWVNISGRVAIKILEAYRKESDDLDNIFEDIEREILNDLKIDVWSRFIYTDLGYDAINECSSLPTVITEDPILILLTKFQNSSLGEKLDEEKLKEFSKILSNSTILLQTYLSSKWKDTVRLNELYQDSFQFHSNEKLMNVPDTNLKSNVSVKILILEKSFDKLTSLINPILTTFNPTSEDLYYSAIMIGPFILEWNSFEICIPRKCVSKAAVMVSDIETNFSLSKMDKILPSLAKLIVEYNINYGYHKKGESQNVKFKNSQEFVEDVLKLIQLDINKISPPLLQLLKNIKKYGYTKLDFVMSPIFRNTFNIDEKSVCFTSHEQLDLFVNRLNKINSNFSIQFKDEYTFLKGIDRAFWLKYNSLLELPKKIEKQLKDKYQPWIKEIYDEDLDETDEQISCPFKDPSKTQSFLLSDLKTGFSFFFKK